MGATGSLQSAHVAVIRAAEIAAMRRGILLASASAGTGHMRAAEALRSALIASDPELRVEHVDVLELAPAWVRAAYRDGFELIAARAPGVWREIYHITDGPGVDAARWSPLAQKLLFRAFERVVRGGDWSACVATHFLPAQLMAGRAGAPPFGVVVTDFGLHRYWAQPGARTWFVATDELVTEVQSRVRGARAVSTGIPVRPDLLSGPTRDEARAQLGLTSSQPVVAVMGGGLGLGVTPLALAAAAASGVQVLALCGRSESAYRELQNAARVRAVGYVDDIRPYYAAADLVITKPGGLTSSEALAVGCPLLLSNAIPGHEEENARQLVRAGAALEARSGAEVREAVGALTESPARLSALANAARRLGRPHAAATIAAELEREFLLREVA